MHRFRAIYASIRMNLNSGRQTQSSDATESILRAGLVAAAQGEHMRAVTLLSCAEAIVAESGYWPIPPWQVEVTAAFALLQDSLSAAEYLAAALPMPAGEPRRTIPRRLSVCPRQRPNLGVPVTKSRIRKRCIGERRCLQSMRTTGTKVERGQCSARVCTVQKQERDAADRRPSPVSYAATPSTMTIVMVAYGLPCFGVVLRHNWHEHPEFSVDSGAAEPSSLSTPALTTVFVTYTLSWLVRITLLLR